MTPAATGSELPKVWPTVVHMLIDAAQRSPSAIALICGSDHLTYEEYASCVAGVAARLRDLGIGSGDRVALAMSNCADLAIATFGVQAAGAQVVPVNPSYTASEFGPILENAECIAILFDATASTNLQNLLHSFRTECAIRIGTDGERLTRWRGAGLALEVHTLPDTDQLSTLQYTGGTTGRSKGVNLTHRSVAINVSQREALLPTRPDCERVLAMTPLFHVYAVAMCLYLAAYCRGTLVILERTKPELALRAVADHRITLMSGSPTIFIGMMASVEFARTDLSSLALCYSGSAALAPDTLRRWQDATGCGVCEGYGQSESGPVLAFNPVRGARKIGSVGVSVPRTDIDIVDVETGKHSLGRGQIGEIRARGPQIMAGYRALAEETSQALRDGWLYTGDIGEIDADGYLFIRDRKKEMVIVSGYNVYPREVEEALLAHPAVREAAVVGVHDDYRGEALLGYVSLANGAVTEADLKEFLGKRLVRYKIPTTIRFIDELPKTPVGKTDKNSLRDAAKRAAG